MSDTIEGRHPIWSARFTSTDDIRAEWDLHEGGGGFGNAELQTYLPAQASVVGSSTQPHQLVITAVADNDNFRSAKLTSKRTLGADEGYIEAKLAVPCDEGIWPAFWAMPGPEMGLQWPDGVGSFALSHWYLPTRTSLADTGMAIRRGR
jgi:beta-glucanase (GH16 family)